MNTEPTANITNRKCTDKIALILLGSIVIIAIIYCSLFSNMNIWSDNRDDCGNICGELNTGNLYDQCGPHDKQNQSKVLAERHENMTWLVHFSCIDECPANHTEIANHCWKIGDVRKPPMTYYQFIKDISVMIKQNWWEIFVFCPFSFIFSAALMILLKFVPKTTLWVSHISFILVASLVSFFFLALAFYIPWWVNISYAIFWFIVFEVILLIWFGKRMKIVAKMCNETTRTMLKIPWIAILPTVTFIILTILISTFLFISLLIESSGIFSPGSSEDGKFQLKYETTQLMKVARILNILTFAWLGNFFINCQHFVVAGSVTKWYFTRDKSGMGGISKSSIFNLLRFHLGSVCFGSIVVPFVRLIHFGFRVVKQIKDIIEKYFRSLQSPTINKHFDTIEKFLGSLTKSNYILIARSGIPFFQSGNRIYDLVLKNLGDVYGLNYFKDMTLLICQLMVVLFSLIVGFVLIDIPNPVHILVAPIVVAFIFAFIVTHSFFMAYGIIIDTLLVCFGIDCEENDGDLNPYFMINSLKKIVVEIKKKTFENRSDGGCNVESNLNQMYEAF